MSSHYEIVEYRDETGELNVNNRDTGNSAVSYTDHSRSINVIIIHTVTISMLHLEILHFFAFSGSVLFIAGPFSFAEAEHVCRRHGASLAKVGQIYSSWKFQQLDHCDGGWLQDISVRFPIIHPRERCGGIAEPGVPSKSLRPIGAYCYR